MMPIECKFYLSFSVDSFGKEALSTSKIRKSVANNYNTGISSVTIAPMMISEKVTNGYRASLILIIGYSLS